jgi:5-formyltetrahydrofolate cyclo-ligase
MDETQSAAALIRQEKRRYRQSLTPETISQASAKARELLCDGSEFASAQVIAIYYPAQGEVDPLPLLDKYPHKTFALPFIVTEPHNHLHFYRYESGDRLHANKFGIDEPEAQPQKRLLVTDIDLILVPMVAFDKKNNRMGHGAGFYDRSLAFTRSTGKPYFVGFAYDWQRVPSLPVREWDVPMDVVVTDQQVYR